MNRMNPTNPTNPASPVRSISLEHLLTLPARSWNALPPRVRVFLERLVRVVLSVVLKTVYNLVLVAAPTVAAVLVRVGLIALTAVQPWPALRTFHTWGLVVPDRLRRDLAGVRLARSSVACQVPLSNGSP
jgi:hypothetical protein